jgi:hypothetical protein
MDCRVKPGNDEQINQFSKKPAIHRHHAALQSTTAENGFFTDVE